MITYYLGHKYVRADLPMAVSNATRDHYRRPHHADDDTLVRWAEASLSRPPDFGYFGGQDLFRSWGMTPIVQTRDSDALEESNYARIYEDLRAAHPDEDMGYYLLEWVTDFRSGHWACGWLDQILARVLYDPDEDITPDNITGAFRMVMEIADYLASDYPIYDESDFSEREHAQAWESFEQEWAWMLRRWDDADGPEPTEAERDHIWSAYDLMYEDSRKDADTLEEHVFYERAERIKAAKAAVSRLLKG